MYHINNNNFKFIGDTNDMNLEQKRESLQTSKIINNKNKELIEKIKFLEEYQDQIDRDYKIQFVKLKNIDKEKSKEIEEKDQIIQKYSSDIQRYKEIIESLECKLNHYRRENEEIKDINSKKETIIQMFRNKSHILEIEFNIYKIKKEEEIKKLGESNNEIIEIGHSKIRDLMMEIDLLKELGADQCRQYESILNEYQNTINEYQDTVKTFREENEKIKTNQKDELKKVNTKIKVLNNSILSLGKENEELEQRNRDQRNEIQELRLKFKETMVSTNGSGDTFKEYERKEIINNIMNSIDPYQLFGINNNNSNNNQFIDQKMVNNKFRQWALLLHSDKNCNSKDNSSDEAFKKLSDFRDKLFK
ncbi:hypothetical protein DICPUDRAFT_96882 [Dictyostelium purpureum]|uniref:J domain-containing protein n=1 Tax=Dictyostelium purpureum TaxID=5786 RepID=F0ZC14_DICPU|nr:uncharacterized protein DICPUDRAFT_96882 [Dictyostelium purpureum]EGC38489.1 hypothetical protein DICPUDRAFT_96882 [Dictyostelium purpureum]|eukprot:XP_003284954.1 hypothetical protein DICPUDRAFT_96882 [Dictyostelium purpureum]